MYQAEFSVIYKLGILFSMFDEVYFSIVVLVLHRAVLRCRLLIC